MLKPNTGSARAHRRAIDQVLEAYDDGAQADELLKLGRSLGLRSRHVRKAIAGKPAFRQVAHAFTSKPRKRIQRLGGAMTRILSIAQIAIDKGWAPGRPNPLKPGEVVELKAAMKRVVLPRYNINAIKLYRDPAEASRMIAQAQLRRDVRAMNRLSRAPDDQILNRELPQAFDQEPATSPPTLGVMSAEPDPLKLATTCPVCGREGLKPKADGSFRRHKTPDGEWCDGA